MILVWLLTRGLDLGVSGVARPSVDGCCACALDPLAG